MPRPPLFMLGATAPKPLFLVLACSALVASAAAGCTAQAESDSASSEAAQTVASGTVVWAAQYASAYSDTITGAETDAAGNVYTAGYLGDGNGGQGVHVLKYSSTGVVLYDRYIPVRAGTNVTANAQAFTVSPSGEVWLAGKVQSGTFTSAGAPPYVQFIAKLDASGNVAFVTELNSNKSPYADWITRIRAVPGGGAALVGRFTENAAFALPGQALPKVAPFSTFVAKLDASGNHVWNHVLSQDQVISGLGVTTTGDVYAAGEGCSPDFGAGPIVGNATTFCKSMFVVKLAGADGHQIWGKAAGTNEISNSFAAPLAVMPDGGVATTGVYTGSASLDFGAGPLPATSTQTPLIVRYDGSGNVLYSRSYPELVASWTDHQAAAALAATSSGGLVLAGHADIDASPRRTLISQISANGTLVKSMSLDSWRPPSGASASELRIFGLVSNPDDSIFVAGTFGYLLTIGPRQFRTDDSRIAQEDALLARLRF